MKRTSPLRRAVARSTGTDLVLDPGTANARVHVRGHGLVLDAPSLVAVDPRGTVVAAGHEAVRRVREDPAGLRLQRPLRGGVIADFPAAVAMARTFFDLAAPGARPSVIVCVPSDITAVERAAFQDMVLAAGAQVGFVIEDPVAAAIGTGLAIDEETPTMVADVGAGTTDVAVMSSGAIAVSQSVPLGGDDVDVAIAHHLLERHGVRISQRSAERIKLALGALVADDGTPGRFEVHGRIGDGDAPVAAEVKVGEVLGAIDPVIAGMAGAVATTLDRASVADAADLLESGVLLTGGSALLPGLDRRITEVTGLPVRISEEPLSRVAAGAGTCLETADDLSVIFAGTVARRP